MATLEEAGIVFDPWTTQSIWGQPPAAVAGPVQQSYGAHDTSAYPELSEPQFARSDVHQGSSRAKYHERTPKFERQAQNQYTSLLFVAVLSAALLWRRM